MKRRYKRTVDGITFLALYMEIDDFSRNVLSVFEVGNMNYKYTGLCDPIQWEDDRYLLDLIYRASLIA